ncbi:hypothetical protein [Kitasatospora aureofaciens]|uniref:hypothetical protein n=1 Tax=Kitasatospora aureofaciens TaxID=1894 RepID=UPI001C472934|nr:hypothetical protein [Kitasatospora aureofaciens]MBV6699896.1 hypothetical protein [Kitasatospora aureofaciens]
MQITQLTRTAPTTPRKRAGARTVVLAAAVIGAALGGTVPAGAADGDGIAGYQSAQQVLQSGQTKDTVSRFLVASRQAGNPASNADGGMTGAPATAPAAVAAPPRFDLKDPVPMFELSADFVAGKNPTTPLRLTYLASRVSAADDHQAAVLLAPTGSGASGSGAQPDGTQNVGSEGWELAGIRDGDADISLAERGTAQARTFTEPQIHAWYRLTDKGMVEPLNQEATTSLGGQNGITLAAYQKLVNSRYGDKLPGSEYDRKGLAGGYNNLTDEQPQQPGAQDRPQPAVAQPTQTTGISWQLAAANSAAALAAVGAAAVYLRRRRTADAH